MDCRNRVLNRAIMKTLKKIIIIIYQIYDIFVTLFSYLWSYLSVPPRFFENCSKRKIIVFFLMQQRSSVRPIRATDICKYDVHTIIYFNVEKRSRVCTTRTFANLLQCEKGEKLGVCFAYNAIMSPYTHFGL